MAVSFIFYLWGEKIVNLCRSFLFCKQLCRILSEALKCWKSGIKVPDSNHLEIDGGQQALLDNLHCKPEPSWISGRGNNGACRGGNSQQILKNCVDDATALNDNATYKRFSDSTRFAGGFGTKMFRVWSWS